VPFDPGSAERPEDARAAPSAEPSSVAAAQTEPARARLVLNVGSGPARREKLHRAFHGGDWREIRLDLDIRVRPDIVASTADLAFLRDGSLDAIWSSHTIEHLYEHEVRAALSGMTRVLRRDGFVLLTTPDIVKVAVEIAAGRLEDPMYASPAGPITPVDVLFGLRSAIAAGNTFMAHRTAFSAARLGRFLVEAGFAEARVWYGEGFDLWAIGLMPDADFEAIAASMRPDVAA
jgi:SAM-dependent methyltransferase